MSRNQETTAIITQPGTKSVAASFHEWPVHTECPHCNCAILTSLEYKSGTLTFVMCFFLMFIGLFLGCCFIPFCLDGCKDIAHMCPNCKKEISRYYRI